MTKWILAVVLAGAAGFGLDRASDGADQRGDFILLLLIVLPVTIACGLALIEAVRTRSTQAFVVVWRGLLAGAAAGLVLGVALRVGMRGVALTANLPLQFSLAGSWFVLMFGIFYGASFGSLFAALRRRFHSRRPGIGFGAVLGGLFWFPFFDNASRDIDGNLSGAITSILTSAMSAVWIAYGGVLGRLTRRIDNPNPSGSA